MIKQILFLLACTLSIINFTMILAQSPLSKCEAYYTLKMSVEINIEELKRKALEGDIESALALIDLNKIFSQSNEGPVQNVHLKNLKILSSSGHLLNDIKSAFSEETYKECKYIFDLNNHTLSNEEALLNNNLE